MNILKTFKNNAGKMLAMTALFTLGALASNAQQKQQPTDTLVKKKVQTPMTKISEKQSGDTTITTYRETYLQERQANKSEVITNPAPESSTLKKMVAPPKQKLMPNDQWVKFLADYKAKHGHDWVAPKKKKVDVVQQPAAKNAVKNVEKKTSQYDDQKIYVRDSTVIRIGAKTLPPETDTLYVDLPKLKVKRPWRFAVGVGQHWRMNATPDPNAGSMNHPPETKWNIDPTVRNFAFARLTTPKLGPKGSVLNWAELEAEVQVFENDPGYAFLVQHQYNEGNQGPGAGSAPYDFTVNTKRLRDNARVSGKFGPTIGKGFLKVNPYIQGGGFFQRLADVEVVSFNGQAPTRLMPEEKKILKNNQASLFYGAGLSIYGDFNKKKIKNNVKTDRGPYFVLNASMFKTTQSVGLGTDVSGYTHGGQPQVNISGGFGFRF